MLQGLKLYFRVLEAMVRSESERKGRLSLTDLLTSKSFHTCLLACSFEVVSAAYHMVRAYSSRYELLSSTCIRILLVLWQYFEIPWYLTTSSIPYAHALPPSISQGLAFRNGLTLIL